MKGLLYFLLIPLMATSCQNNKSEETILPDITGGPWEVAIFADKLFRESSADDTLRKYLQQPVKALPQDEPSLTLTHLIGELSENPYRTHRNLVIIKVGKNYPNPAFRVERNRWANEQCLILLTAPDNNACYRLIRAHGEEIMHLIHSVEINRLAKSYRKRGRKSDNQSLEKKHHLSLNIPQGYNLSMDSVSFIWISKAHGETDIGVFIYYFPYNDSIIPDKETLLCHRNNTLKKYVHGPKQGSYMVTSSAFTVYCALRNDFVVPNAMRIQGLWEMQNDFMGGPFISYSFVDSLHNRLVTAEGYVYAPGKQKRLFLWETEAILYTLQIQ
jgi:hypothetical protein